MIRIATAALVLIAAAPAVAQTGGLTGTRASTGSVSSDSGSSLSGTGGGATGSSLGIGNGSGSLAGSASNTASGSLPGISGTNFGDGGTPIGSQSSLSARVNAAAGLSNPSRLNSRLGAGSALYGSSGSGAVAGLSSGTTLTNAGQPSGVALGN